MSVTEELVTPTLRYITEEGIARCNLPPGESCLLQYTIGWFNPQFRRVCLGVDSKGNLMGKPEDYRDGFSSAIFTLPTCGGPILVDTSKPEDTAK